MTLDPEFSGAVTEYEATTSNATNTITATPAKVGAAVSITVNGVSHPNGTAATWDAGENEVVITVRYGTTVRVYTVIVTKTG